jgi:hypothetical protein
LEIERAILLADSLSIIEGVLILKPATQNLIKELAGIVRGTEN